MTGIFSAVRARAALFAAALIASASLQAATAVDDFYSTISDGSPFVMSPLANDTVTIQGGLSGATLVQGQGGVSYDPQMGTVTFEATPGFVGTVLIDYIVSDEVAPTTDTGRITLEVTAPPVLDAVDDFYSMAYNDGSATAPTALPVLNNDSTPGESAPFVSLVVSLSPANAGSLAPNSAGDGFTFLPAPGFSGMATFSYELSQDDAVDTAVVTLTVSPPMGSLQVVNDAVTVAANDGSQQEPIFIDVLGNDTLMAETPYSLGLIGALTPAAAGTLTPAGSGFEFMPAPGFSGEASFTYEVLQSGQSASAAVTLTIGNVTDGGIADNPLLTPEERRVAGALDNACASASGALAVSCGVIGDLPADQQRAAIQQILPNQAPAQALGAFLQQNQQLTNLHGRLQQLRGGAQGFSFSGLSAQYFDQSLAVGGLLERELGGSAGDESPFADTPWGVFVTGRINLGDVDSRGTQGDFDFETLGLTAGIDYRLDQNLVLGGAVGFGTSDNDYDNSRGNLDIDSWTLSFYGNYYPLDNLYVDWVLGYGRNDYSGDRRLRFGPIDAIADYDADGNQYSGSATVGYQWNQLAWQYGAYLRLDYIHTRIDAYRESGGAGLALAMDEQNARSLESALGGRLARAISFSRGVVIPGVELEWVHQWKGDPRRINAALVEAPDSGIFNVLAEALDENYLKAGLSVTGVFTGGKSGFLRYQTSLGRDDISEQTIEAGFRMEF